MHCGIQGVRTKYGPGVHAATLDRVHGPPVMDRAHGQFFLIRRNEQKQK